MEVENHIKELLVRFIAGKLDDLERIQVKNWIDESVENQQYFKEMKKYYQLTKLVKKPGGFNKEQGWERVKAGYNRIYLNKTEDIKSAKKFLIRRYLIPIAAGIMAAFIIGALFNQFIINKKVDNSLVLCEINVPLGSTSQVRLPDGSVAWLNAGSKLSYFNNSFINNRLVMLEGEAYFDVAKIEDKIFVVNTSDIKVKAFGTQFNVKSYGEENIIQTTLVEGSISVEPIKGNSKRNTVILKPNQSANYYKAAGKSAKSDELTAGNKNELSSVFAEKIVVIQKIDPLPITSWKDNYWVIKGESLDNLVVKLERRYNVKIYFQDGSLKKYKFSGILKGETFEQVLKILQITMPILFSVNDNKVTLSEDKAFKSKYDTMIQSPE